MVPVLPPFFLPLLPPPPLPPRPPPPDPAPATPALPPPLLLSPSSQIGRASCRECVLISGAVQLLHIT